MTDMTVVLLNWRRPNNLTKSIEALLAQTARPEIFLWNNADDDFSHPGIDWLMRSSVNQRCWPRWLMASMAQTPYVMSLDDDLLLHDRQAVARLLERLEAGTEYSRIYGLEGLVLGDGEGYGASIKNPMLPCDGDGQPVDIVKGRLMALRRDALDTCVRLHYNVTEDDIAISGLFARGESRRHRVLPELRGMVTELPQPHALWRQSGHWERRERALKDFFPWRK